MKLKQLATAVILATGSGATLAATYSVTPLVTNDNGRNGFAQSIDNAGMTLMVIQDEYNPPIDVTLFDEDFFVDNPNLTDPEGAAEGNFNDEDYLFIINVLQQVRDTATQTQILTQYRSFSQQGSSDAVVPGLDVISESTGNLSQSVDTVARDSIDGNYIVGATEAPYLPQTYVNDDDEDVLYILNDIRRSAFVQVNDSTVRLEPIDDTLGGYGEAFEINDNFQVAGFSSVEFDESIDTAIESCNDDEARGDSPVDRCLRDLRRTVSFFVPLDAPTTASNAAMTFQSTFNAMAVNINATVWNLNSSGDVVSEVSYSVPFEPEADDTVRYQTRAFDINNNGIAVGDSHTGETVDVTYAGENSARRGYQYSAAVFDNNTTTLIIQEDANLNSSAIAINDNNWVTGFVTRAPNEIARNRFFVHNLDTGETRYPEGFFASSSVTARNINNNNIVVGEADIEATNEAVRQRHAFMYNIDTEEFINLNTLIECESSYTLIDAVDINDNNEIIVNARVQNTFRNMLGEEQLDSEGAAVEVDKVVAVKLTPIANGQVEECGTDVIDPPPERQGASLHWLSLGLLSLFGMVRRRKK